MKRVFGATVALVAVWSSAFAQNLSVRDDLAVSKSFLLKTYEQHCQELRDKVSQSVSCGFVPDPAKSRDFIRLKAEVVDTGSDPRERRQISILITPGLFGSDDARKRYLELAKLIALPNGGGSLADKLPTPERVVEFCKSRPEAERDNGCTLNELEREGVHIGLFIMSDADGFFVSVVEERN